MAMIYLWIAALLVVVNVPVTRSVFRSGLSGRAQIAALLMLWGLPVLGAILAIAMVAGGGSATGGWDARGGVSYWTGGDHNGASAHVGGTGYASGGDASPCDGGVGGAGGGDCGGGH
jgi:hypothetical protein